MRAVLRLSNEGVRSLGYTNGNAHSLAVWRQVPQVSACDNGRTRQEQRVGSSSSDFSKHVYSGARHRGGACECPHSARYCREENTAL